MVCVGGGSSKQGGQSSTNCLSYGYNQVEEGEELPWKLVTRKKQSKSQKSSKKGLSVSIVKSRFPKYEPSSRGGDKGKDTTSAAKSGECYVEKTINLSDSSEFPPLLHEPVVRTPSRRGDKVTSKSEECSVGKYVISSTVKSGEYYIESNIHLPGDTDVDSCDGKEDEDEDDDDGFEDQNDARLCDPETWWDTMNDAHTEIKHIWKKEEEKEKDEGKKEEKDGRIIYHVHVDTYFKRNRKPRFGIVLKDPSKTALFGFVEKSKSRGVPQLHTHLEGMLKAAKLAKAYVDNHEATYGGEIQIYIYSNSSYAVNVVEAGTHPANEQFTEGVRRIVKQLKVFTVTNNMDICDSTYFENRAADYLARSPTSKVGQIIPKKDFDKNLETFIEQDKILDDMKSGRSTPEARAIIWAAHRAALG